MALNGDQAMVNRVDCETKSLQGMVTEQGHTVILSEYEQFGQALVVV